MQELDNVRNQLKATAKELSTLNAKFDNQFVTAIRMLKDVFDEVMYRERSLAPPTETTDSWYAQ